MSKTQRKLITYKGKYIEEMNTEELIEALTEMFFEIEHLKNQKYLETLRAFYE